MANAVRIRVEAKNYNPNASWDERERNFKGLMTAFRKARQRSGIEREMKRCEYYEKPGDKKRRKQREAQVNLLKEQLKNSCADSHKRDSYE